MPESLCGEDTSFVATTGNKESLNGRTGKMGRDGNLLHDTRRKIQFLKEWCREVVASTQTSGCHAGRSKKLDPRTPKGVFASEIPPARSS